MAKEKDSYWFKHDSTAGRGLRLRKLQSKFDHWGKGVYWDIVEVLREQSGYKYEADEASLQVLCDLIVVKDFEKFKQFFEYCLTIKLFIRKNGKFYTETLIKNMKKWESTKTNGSKGGRPKGSKNKNRTEKPIESETKPNVNHNSIEDNKRGEDSYTKNQSIRESFFNALPNSSVLETISLDLKIPKETLRSRIETFKQSARTDYKDFYDFCYHFKNWNRKFKGEPLKRRNQPV